MNAKDAKEIVDDYKVIQKCYEDLELKQMQKLNTEKFLGQLRNILDYLESNYDLSDYHKGEKVA